MALFKDIGIQKTGSFLYTGDLVITNGDLDILFSDEQHIQDTILADTGWWKEYPADGVGLQKYLNAAGQQQRLGKNIKIQLQSDGYTVSPAPSISYSGNNLIINPNAKRL